MATTTQDVKTLVKFALEKTARSLERAMNVYWSADEYGKNDLPERNLSLHFAHQLMAENFYAYAEANHPEKSINKGSRINGIDLLATSPDHSYYLACEFKKYGHTMDESSDDLERLATFDLNPKLGKQYLETINQCAGGYGLVAGLAWSNREIPKIDFSHSKTHPNFVARLGKLKGCILDQFPIKQVGVKGGYFLLSALWELDNVRPLKK